MSVRTTSGEKKVALFDSASGFAFGPVFEDEHEADAFVKFVERRIQGDIRQLTDAEMDDQHNVFSEIWSPL